MINPNKIYWARREIEQIEAMLEEICEISSSKVTGIPKGNAGVSAEERLYERKEKLTLKLVEHKQRLEEQEAEVEAFIETIDDPEIRVIARYRYLKCLAWKTIGAELHQDRSTVARKLSEYMQSISE